MPVLIGTEFFDSVAELQPGETARVIDFVSRFQADPAHPSISLERVRNTDADLWSGRISQELRAIIFKDGDTWALLHAGHHDPAYAWAERKQVGRHSVTGALQVVDVERAKAVKEAVSTDQYGQAPGLFDQHDDAYLLSLGLPEPWLPAIRGIQFEDQLLEACEELPPDVAERLINLATGGFVHPPDPSTPVEAPTADTRRRFYIVQDLEEMRAALEAPLEKWITFLHPSQRKLVEGSFNGPVKVTGSAGTGKTVVALHRARALARAGKSVLLATYVTTLRENLKSALDQLCGSDDCRERITVSTVHAAALSVVKQVEADAHPMGADRVRELLDTVVVTSGIEFDTDFVESEWKNVILRQGISSWDEYRTTRRVGRGQPLSVPQRKELWTAFDEVRERMREQSAYAWSGLCVRAQELLESGEAKSPYDAVVVDELQDLNAAEIRFLWALCGTPEDFMVVGDAGQRIYPGGFSLSRLGIEVRGRSHILRVNYRTTEQIRQAADSVLGHEADDMDGGVERRDLTRSLLKGPDPVLAGFSSVEKELAFLASCIDDWLDSGLSPEDIAVFARTNRAVDEVVGHLKTEGHGTQKLRASSSMSESGERVGTMHRAKGLEFKAVAVFNCAADQLPYARSLQGVTAPADQEAALDRERRLLYVAMTRARDELLVTWHGEPSPFLATLRKQEEGEA